MHYLVELTVAGLEAAKFLQGYVTSDLETIQPKHGLPMALTDIKGRVIANGWCYGSATQITLAIHQSLIETVKSHLSRYMVFAKSKFTDETNERSLSAVAVAGEVKLEPYGWGLGPALQTENDLNHLTVAREFPIIQAASSGLFLPQMLNLTQHGAVSFTKGCYLGQEIVARTEHRGQVKRQLFRTNLLDQNVTVGATVTVADRGVCTVVGVYQEQVLLVGRLPKS